MDIQSSGAGDVTAAFGEKAVGTDGSGGCSVGIAPTCLLFVLLPLMFLKK